MKFTTKLTNWYLVNKRDFPWRNTKNPYFVWLSEIILQQTRTLQGLPYYLAFTNTYPTINDLANAKEEEVLKLWQGLGYYSRARNLHFSAKYIVEQCSGKFPETYKDLLQLKGVGDYTASAIASICFDEKCAVVDGNVYRVLSRYFGIDTPINSSKGLKEFKLLAQALLPKKEFGLHNQAIMDFGATICTPKNTQCATCIFTDSCVALQQKKVNSFPVKTSKTKVRKRYFNYLVILSKPNNINLDKRSEKGIWQNLYEFPLVETNHEIELKHLLVHRHFINIVGKINAENVSSFYNKKLVHKLSHQHINAKFWIVIKDSNMPNSIEIKQLKNYPVPTLIDNFIKDFKF